MVDERELAEHYKRPIIFVVHSLGGIIVKAALNRSSATQGTRLKEIAPTTCGVCFLGTPHRGSKSASLGKVAYQISVAATRRPNTRLLQGLEKNSQTLEHVGDAFAQTMLKSGSSLHIYSFREEKETRKYCVFNTMVVDADSAKIGDAREEVGSIPANNSKMTKFGSNDDIGFKRISAQLPRWVQELRTDEALSQEDVRGRGSEPTWTIVAFFFHDRGTSILQKSLSGLLREILSSILGQLPQLLPLAVAMYKKLVKAHGKRTLEWNLEDLTALMRQIVRQRETRIRLLLFLDALDEHAGDNEQLVQMLQEWRESADGYYVNLKVCLASRSWNIFTDNVSDGPTLAIHHHTQDDIRVYTISRLGTLSQGGPRSMLGSRSCASLTEQITAKAQGVFIWVRLVTEHVAKNIRDGTPYQTLEGTVAAMPEELEDLYYHTVARIDAEYTNEAHIIFQMVLCSVEPLTLETLFHASRYSSRLYLHDDKSDETPDMYPEQSLRWLMSRGGGILDVFTGTSTSTPFVQFLHPTAKEYLESPKARDLMERVAAPVAAKSGPYFLALCAQSCAYWTAVIKENMLYYIKLVETDRQLDKDIILPLSFKEPEPSDVYGSNWWLRQQSDTFFQRYKTGCTNYHLSHSSFGDVYQRLVNMVAANLIWLVKGSLPLNTLDIIGNAKRMDIYLLQAAIGTRSLVPAHLEDRAAMVQTLLSLGYPADVETHPLNAVHGGYKPQEETYTPLEFLLTTTDANIPNEDTRLSIAKLLLDAGASYQPKLKHHYAKHHNAAMGKFLTLPMNGLEELYSYQPDP
ncbi:MAG: hypothetical protein LQ350_007159 [Teloschistes chrysophthalmus]|nr:MAG: hypothetical protein LQ350_007159 [Niorma chrysophthalma]